MVYKGKPYYIKWMIGQETHYFRKHPYIKTHVPKIGGCIANDEFSINPISEAFTCEVFRGVVVLGPSFFLR